MHVAIVGATGAVGNELQRILQNRNFPLEHCQFFASSRSAGKVVHFAGKEHTVQIIKRDTLKHADLAFFSAGTGISRQWAPELANDGVRVIDNSSAFRADPNVPLVIPEINPEAIRNHNLIANPNCSTIILALALWPLHKNWNLRRAVVATYQAISGAGARALDELHTQTWAVLTGERAETNVFREPCAFNVFSHDSPIDDAGFNNEENKLLHETRKIFADPNPYVVATCMRVPVPRTHLEAVACEFEQSIDPVDARSALANAPGVRLVDDPEQNVFPTALAAANHDDVLVGRVRHDPSVPNHRGLMFIVAGDQLRKGAALNAVQIAEHCLKQHA